MLSPWGVSGAFGSPWFTVLDSCKRLMVKSFTISRTYKVIHQHVKTMIATGSVLMVCSTVVLHEINQNMVYAAKQPRWNLS